MESPSLSLLEKPSPLLKMASLRTFLPFFLRISAFKNLPPGISDVIVAEGTVNTGWHLNITVLMLCYVKNSYDNT